MSVYETSITNPKKQLEFYKDLSEQLESENKELKKQLKIKQDGFMASVEDLCEYARENERLQKQLEIGKEQYNDLVEEKEKIQEELSSKILQLDNQQKEFIEWLEIRIKDRDKVRKMHELYSLSEERLSSQYFILQDILSKYKEIVGVKDE